MLQRVDSVAPSAVADYRADYRAEQIGPHYRGWLHFAFTSGVCLTVIAACVSRTHAATLGELCTIPATFLFANGVEWFGHRFVMHRPRPGLAIVYRRHTVEHHHFFTHDLMSFESSRDFKMVLFPPAMLLFFFGLFAAPIGLVLARFMSPNIAYLYVATAFGYFISYEWLHFAYHLPADSWLGSIGLFAGLRRHHQQHHNLALMGRWNYNITFPICDLLFGTYHPVQ